MKHGDFIRILMNEADPGDGTGDSGGGGGNPPADPPASPPPGTGNEDWRSSLPEQFREAPFIKGADSVDAALTAISNAASHMGNSIRVPSEDASAEDKQKFVDKILEKTPELMYKPTDENREQFLESLGRPKKAEDYKIDVEEGQELPFDFKQFSELAFENGLTQNQFKGILTKVMEQQSTEAEMAEAEHKTEMDALNKEWGMAFDQNMSRVKNYLDLTDAPEGIKKMFEEGVMSADEVKWINEIATRTRSDVEIATQEGKSNNGALSPGEAQARINEIQANEEHPYWNPTDPRHEQAKKDFINLHRMRDAGR